MHLELDFKIFAPRPLSGGPNFLQFSFVQRLLLFLLTTFVLSVSAQNLVPFTQYLQQQEPGKGSVVLIQDAEIEALVNNLPEPEPQAAPAPHKPTPPAKPAAGRGEESKAKPGDATVAHGTKYNGQRVRHKVRGFRIQVYSGAGNAAAKREAKQMEARVRQAFPELAVYCHFKSPRWVCRVGDFATREEALRYLSKIRAQNISVEASIVSDEVLVVN